MNAILYTLGWIATLYLVSNGWEMWAFLGAIFPLGSIFVYEFLNKNRWFWEDLFLAFYALLLGYLLEIFFIHFGVIDYSTRIFPPIWILLLYPLFSTTFNHSLDWVNSHLVYSLLLALLAPFSYFAGEKIGACQLLLEPIWSYTIIAIGYGLLLSSLFFVNQRLRKVGSDFETLHRSPSKVSMLFDGNCSVCSKEACLLEKAGDKIDFVDITAEGYGRLPGQPTYEEAMKAMNVMSEGETKIGVDGLFLLYAKAGWKGLAFLLKAPLFSKLSQIGYKLFAKYRRKFFQKG